MVLPLNHPLNHKGDPIARLEARVAALEKVVTVQVDGSVNIQTPSGIGRIRIKAGNVDIQSMTDFNCKAGGNLLMDGSATFTTKAGGNMYASAGMGLNVKAMGIVTIDGSSSGVNVYTPQGKKSL